MDNKNNNSDFEEYYNSLSMEERQRVDEIRKRMAERREKRRIANHKRVVRNRIIALIIILVVVLLIVKSCMGDKEESVNENSSAETTQTTVSAVSDEKPAVVFEEPAETTVPQEQKKTHTIETNNGMTFVDGILIVNKTYSLPADYDPGISQLAQNAFNEMVAGAASDGITLYVNSGYRSYSNQEQLYNTYVYERGVEEADYVSARPGHSEHQTGLAFDVNTTDFSFEYTPEALWLAEHCWEYGFIIRYPEGKEDITGYAYEPWHIRYLGKDIAKDVYDSGLCLEEYLDITSCYDEY